RHRGKTVVDVEFWRAGQGGGIDLASAEGVHCVRGSGRGSHALLATGSASLWCVLRGRVEVTGADGTFRVEGRHFLALPAGAVVRGVGREGADWVAVALPPAAVETILRSIGLRGGPRPLLFSCVLPMDRALVRALAAVVRLAGS